jgi:LPXTG-site transpeptidase (sortase) family protein
MADTAHTETPLTKSDRRRRWGDYLLVIGLLLLFGVALSLIKISLTTQQSGYQHYLASEIELPVLTPAAPTLEPTPEPTRLEEEPAPEPAPVEEEAAPDPARMEEEAAPDASLVYLPLIQHSGAQETPVSPPVEEQGGSVQANVPEGAFAGPSAGPVVRLVIPSLHIDRAVVMVGLRRDADNRLTWNTNALFSTSNRSDLVGQTITSANPGEGGNIILIGHNYNNGWYANEAVFVNLLDLKPGSQITLYTESGKEFRYTVESVKKVPWQEQNNAELEKHHKYMWPTDHEQLTLVTCGGTNLLSWSARIYAVAVPAQSQANQ